jgi:GNAT superfamily N-acetyltransferase
VEPARVLAEFDAEMRAVPERSPADAVEEVDGVVRVVGAESWVTFSQLDARSAPAAVRAQAAFFRGLGRRVEWKLFAHDRPPELAHLLEAAGFVAEPTETMVALDLTEASAATELVPGVEVRRATGAVDLELASRVSLEAFGAKDGWQASQFAPRLGDPTLGVFLAWVDGEPVGEGRLELPEGRRFASLWGGGTAPAYRGRGVYRALVAARAVIARARGFRYLTVDARPTSRPILERLGFMPLDSVTGWVLDPLHGP